MKARPHFQCTVDEATAHQLRTAHDSRQWNRASALKNPGVAVLYPHAVIPSQSSNLQLAQPASLEECTPTIYSRKTLSLSYLPPEPSLGGSPSHRYSSLENALYLIIQRSACQSGCLAGTSSPNPDHLMSLYSWGADSPYQLTHSTDQMAALARS